MFNKSGCLIFLLLSIGCSPATLVVREYQIQGVQDISHPPFVHSLPPGQPPAQPALVEAPPIATLVLQGKLVFPSALNADSLSPGDFIVHLRDTAGALKGVTTPNASWEYRFEQVVPGERYIIRAIQISRPTVSLGAIADIGRKVEKDILQDMTPYSTAILLIYEKARELSPELANFPIEHIENRPELIQAIAAVEKILALTLTETSGAPLLSLEDTVKKTADLLSLLAREATGQALPPLRSSQSAIAFFEPIQGRPGDTISVAVRDLPPESKKLIGLRLGGFAADILSVVELSGVTLLNVKVPAAALSGPITLQAGELDLRSETNFLVLPPPAPTPTPQGVFKSAENRFQQPIPTLTTLQPETSPIGTRITLTGTNLYNVIEAKVGTIRAEFTEVSRETLELTVPANAATARVQVTTAGGIAVSSQSLAVSSHTFNGLVSGLFSSDLSRIVASNPEQNAVTSGNGAYQLVVPKTNPLPSLNATWANKPAGWASDYTISLTDTSSFICLWPLASTAGALTQVQTNGQLRITDGVNFHPAPANFTVSYPPPTTGINQAGSLVSIPSASEMFISIPTAEINDKSNLQLTLQGQNAISVPYDLWQTTAASLPVNLTNNPGASQEPATAADSTSRLHTFWNEGNEILSSFSNDRGASWSAAVNLSANAGASQSAAVVALGTTLHLAWQDATPGNNEIFYSRSSDSGASWSAAVNLSSNAGSSQLPAIAGSGANVWLAWQDATPGNNEILYCRSTDSGASWSAPVNLSSNAGSSQLPAIAGSGANVWLAWQDATPGNNEILYSRSTDTGANWSASVNLSASGGSSAAPSLAGSGATVFLAWQEVNDIVERRSGDSGATWSALPPVNISNSAAASQLPHLAFNGALAHVTWQENNEIFYSKFLTGDLTWTTPLNQSNNAGASQRPQLVIAGDDTRYLLWQDITTGNDEIVLRRRLK